MIGDDYQVLKVPKYLPAVQSWGFSHAIEEKKKLKATCVWDPEGKHASEISELLTEISGRLSVPLNQAQTNAG